MKRQFVVLVLLTLCAACARPTLLPTSTPHPTSTPTPTPEPKTLTVCLSEEPESLYLYSTVSTAARHIWQAIYDGPLDSRDYVHQPVILAHLPSLAHGDAAVERVTAQAGDRVLAASGDVIDLAPGVAVRNAGGEAVTFDGTPVPMRQMVVTFTLHSDLHWSDGAPLTAEDSVFSFELASHPATPTDKHVIKRTADYQAVDPRTVVWRGIPGFIDQAYFLNFWPPLPQHAWGHLLARELLNADVATRRPLGWGAFVIQEWVPGDHLTVVRNPHYFRASEGLPHLDEVSFRFIADVDALAEDLRNGRCDVVPHDAADAVLAKVLNGGELPPRTETISTHDARWELLAFGISPASDYERPDFFEDVRVRQGIARCIDRQAIMGEVLGSAGRVLHSYLPPEHPLYAGEKLIAWEYEPEEGQKLLAQAGWYDEDGDGIREAHGLPGIADRTPFHVTYHTTDDPMRVRVAQLVHDSLAACGVRISIETMPSEELLAPGPEGALFGRRFDLIQFSWRATSDPLCDLFLSSQTPDPENWTRPNVVGFLDDEYDSACRSALEALPGSDGYVNGHLEAQRIFSERLPVLPLFQRLKITLVRTSVTGLAPDPTQASELWNLEKVDVQR